MRLATAALLLPLCALGASSAALAEQPPAQLQCGNSANPKLSRDCFRGEVFVLDGGPYEDGSAYGPCTTNAECRSGNPSALPNRVCVDPSIKNPDGGIRSAQATGTTVETGCEPGNANCRCLAETVWCATPGPVLPDINPYPCKTWVTDHGQAVDKFRKILTQAGLAVPDYDQLVIWATEYENNVFPPHFERFLGKNKVDGLGLPVANPFPEYNFRGWVAAGNTQNVDDELIDPMSAYFNMMDILSQAAGSLYAPYVKFKTFDPAQSSAGLTVAGAPRLWSALAGIPSDVMGGNVWKDNGNGTYTSALPALPPYLRGLHLPGYENREAFSFLPIDLYLLGFAPNQGIDPILLFDRTTADVVSPLPTPAGYGAGMGFASGITIRPGKKWLITIDDIIAQEGERAPAYENAEHSVKQAWIATTIPGWTPDNQKEVNKRVIASGIRKVENWRKTFNWYFYMLTRFTGRMITTFDNVDDSPYWEFSQPIDDKAAFTPDGLTTTDPADGAITVTTPGEAGKMSYGATPLRIRTEDMNAFTVRMRLPPNGPKDAHAKLVVGGKTLQLPGVPEATLIPDGLWHTYSANLSEDAVWKGTAEFGAFSFIPADKAATIDIDFIRFLKTPNPKDTDTGIFHHDTMADNRGKAEADGWIDDFDNCPAIYNPSQADGNADGVGDACEDYDGDAVPNALDNCPTLTNSRQRDEDSDGIGDICDESTPAGCCLGLTVAGSSFVPDAWQGGFALALIGGLAWRRRRRR